MVPSAPRLYVLVYCSSKSTDDHLEGTSLLSQGIMLMHSFSSRIQFQETEEVGGGGGGVLPAKLGEGVLPLICDFSYLIYD